MAEEKIPFDFPDSAAEVFQPGQLVILKSNPAVQGAILQVQSGGQEARYSVFIENQIKTYYANQLISVNLPTQPEKLDLAAFHAHLTALELLHPGTNAIYSLHAARITFIPYQFRPILKLIRSDRPRLLIADEVGVGKTIEAGLILRELQSRRDLRSVLVLCPKALVTDRKWQNELKRFDENFTQLDGPTLRNCITETDLDGEWPVQYSKTIVPFSLLDEQLLFGSEAGRLTSRRTRRIKGLLELDPPPRFDLVIVDEAHHLRNPDTQVHQAVRFFCEHAEAVIFLTATPIQLGAQDLFNLLNILRPDLFIDRNAFDALTEPNPAINSAIRAARAARNAWQAAAAQSLQTAGQTQAGQSLLQLNPNYQTALRMVSEQRELTSTERLEFIRQAEELHTLSNVISRTRRRDIGKFTTRHPETVSIPFTPEQQQLHDLLLETQARILRQFHDATNISFLLTTLRRQAASSIHGLAPLLEEILSRRDINSLLEDFELDNLELDSLFSTNIIVPLQQNINQVLDFANKLSPFDPKLEAFLNIVKQKQALPNNKLLAFSAFRHTLSYLESKLQNQGVRVGIVHGGVADEMRQHLRHRFSLPKADSEALDLLLSSEVGCEGLDYQFCDCLINYDIPWNPMRIEQRIGRIDRYGQASEKVLIYNLITPGTVDADIYERCLLRIRIFHEAIGGNEEILGALAQRIQAIAENLKLTKEERSLQLQQLADNEIRLQQEQQELEARQVELFGITLPHNQLLEDIEAATSSWLLPQALRNLVEVYLVRLAGEGQYILGGLEKPVKLLRVSQEVRHKLLEDYKQLGFQTTTSSFNREWEQWLKGGNPNLDITFDHPTAAENRGLTFITPVHPLAQQAAKNLGKKANSTTLQTSFYSLLKIVAQPDLAPGKYPFAIYQWRRIGIREDVRLQPICLQNGLNLGGQLTKLLLNAQNVSEVESQTVKLPDSELFDQLEKQNYAQWQTALQQHVEETQRLASFRRQSLESSHRARLVVINEQLSSATNDKIYIMRKAQLANAQADYGRRLQDINEAEKKATIESNLVAYGILIVES